MSKSNSSRQIKSEQPAEVAPEAGASPSEAFELIELSSTRLDSLARVFTAISQVCAYEDSTELTLDLPEDEMIH